MVVAVSRACADEGSVSSAQPSHIDHCQQQEQTWQSLENEGEKQQKEQHKQHEQKVALPTQPQHLQAQSNQLSFSFAQPQDVESTAQVCVAWTQWRQ